MGGKAASAGKGSKFHWQQTCGLRSPHAVLRVANGLARDGTKLGTENLTQPLLHL
ncbi:MAG TPA: hypothetical protein IGS37_00865 [Synechococcales cyanobacterium M55_K2018_004]|nr:hypothetical protein [Synechococcales cyanobacterium M55_K2018_004]